MPVGRHQHATVGDIEIGIASRETLAVIFHHARHGQFHDAQRISVLILHRPQTVQILLQETVIGVGRILLNHSDHGPRIREPSDIIDMPIGVITNDSIAQPENMAHPQVIPQLLFNLLPIFPLDGGKIVQALLWPKMGFARSMRMSCRIGIVSAVGVGLFALIRNDTMLLGIALFGGITCYLTSRRVAFESDFLGFSPEESESDAELEYAPPARSMFAAAGGATTSAPPKKPVAATPVSAADASIDRVLDKISRDGIGSLSAAEQEVLRKATDERRKRDGRG